jgi:serine protease inhibitor
MRSESKSANAGFAATVRGSANLASNLYRELAGAIDANFVFSPISLYSALAMTYAGARGKTEAEIGRVLSFPASRRFRAHDAVGSLIAKIEDVHAEGPADFRAANMLWPQDSYPVLESFRSLLQKSYGAAIQTLDYHHVSEARKQINQWVAEKTSGKIKDIVGAGVLSADTRLVLTNAVYFKGNWVQQFSRDMTVKGPFWVTRRRSIEVPMMNQTAEVGYFEQDDLKVLELPYAGSLSMVLALPSERDGLSKLEQDLSNKLRKLAEMAVPRRVRISIPRFHVESKFSMRDNLRAMGMSDAFDSRKANFSGIDGKDSQLYLNDVLQNAYIDVNEEGAEAAAATVPIVQSRLVSMPLSFSADHPFMFCVRDRNTGSICFLGRFVAPK